MTIADTLLTSEIKHYYSKINIDVDRLIGDTDRFDLIEEDCGLLKWSPAIPGDSKFYEDLSRFNWYYSKEKDEFLFAKPWILGKTVLEIGCGFGYFADNAPCKKYRGLELNIDAAEVAKAKGHNVECMSFVDYADIYPEAFDVVCSFQVLEHLVDPSKYFKSAFKLLKPGGILLTSVPSESSFVGTINPRNNVLNCPPHHLTRWSDKALEAYPKSFGYISSEIHHLPVERQHQKWFIASLLSCGYQSIEQRNKPTPSSDKLLKIKMRLTMALLRILGSNFSVPSNYFIPGHTVVSIHKKSEVISR